MQKKSFLCTLFLFIAFTMSSQSTENKSLKIGGGLGYSQSDNCFGTGTLYSIGYQQNIWKDRLRFNPNLSLGFYRPLFITDIPDQYFNSINLNANLNLDLIRLSRLSLLIYAGGEAGMTQGYVSTIGSVNDFHLGVDFGGGIRINSKSKKTALNILPFNFRFGYPNFMESYLKLEFDVKL
ncbi:MAG: hypothetical protein QM800_03010 [Paludibacter sp.]